MNCYSIYFQEYFQGCSWRRLMKNIKFNCRITIDQKIQFFLQIILLALAQSESYLFASHKTIEIFSGLTQNLLFILIFILLNQLFNNCKCSLLLSLLQSLNKGTLVSNLIMIFTCLFHFSLCYKFSIIFFVLLV